MPIKDIEMPDKYPTHRLILRVIAHPRLGEIYLGHLLSFTSACWWCFALLMDGESMARPTYSLMRHLGGDDLWAIIFGLASLFQGLRLFSPINLPACVHRAVSFLIALLWSSVACAMVFGIYPIAPAIGGEIVVALVSVWVFAQQGYAKEY